MDAILTEIKGSEIRRWARSTDRSKSRQAGIFIDDLLRLLASNGCRVVARVWIKAHGAGLKPSSTYCYAIQDLSLHFNHLLVSEGDIGIVVCDSRAKSQDVNVAHSLFTMKHKTTGDSLPNLADTAMFARSDNLVGLQIADLIASAIIFPMAAAAFTPSYVASLQGGSAFSDIRRRNGNQLKAIRYTYRDQGKNRGGIVVSDKVGLKSSGHLFG